jgi:DNA-binding response OmpR family regulator
MSCTLLLVEDHLISRQILALALRRANHDVHEAETGEAAVELLSSVDFRVVISDFRLPGKINGLEVLRCQREKAPEARLLLVTAFGSDQVQKEAEALGALYLEKPVSLQDMLSRIIV